MARKGYSVQEEMFGPASAHGVVSPKDTDNKGVKILGLPTSLPINDPVAVLYDEDNPLPNKQWPSPGDTVTWQFVVTTFNGTTEEQFGGYYDRSRRGYEFLPLSTTDIASGKKRIYIARTDTDLNPSAIALR